MRIVKQPFDLTIEYPVEQIAPLEKILFFDIETTGFTARSSHVYLIGCAYYDGHTFQLIQWFSETSEDEKYVIQAFFEFSENFTHIVHFNGNNLIFRLFNKNVHFIIFRILSHIYRELIYISELHHINTF